MSADQTTPLLAYWPVRIVAMIAAAWLASLGGPFAAFLILVGLPVAYLEGRDDGQP